MKITTVHGGTWQNKIRSTHKSPNTQSFATQTNLAQLQQGELEKLLPLLKKEMTSYQIALMMEVQVRSKDEKN